MQIPVIKLGENSPVENSIVEMLNMVEAIIQPEKLRDFRDDENFSKIVENACLQNAKALLLKDLIMENAE